MMKNNYPIKYAVMALEEYKGDEVDVKDVDKNFDIYAYIVSECYLIGERIIYLPDGDNRHKYEIVYTTKVASSGITLPFTDEYEIKTISKYNLTSEEVVAEITNASASLLQKLINNPILAKHGISV